MTDVWQRALSPSRHVVLGLELQPLTLGHVRLLASLDSALLTDRTPSIQDLITAVLVCAQPWEEAERDMGKGWRFNLVMAFWGWKCRKIVRDGMLSHQSQLLDEYLSEALEVPAFTPKGDAKLVDREAPWFWRLLVLLMTQFGMSKRDALNMPVVEANLLWITKGEMEDTLRIATDVEEDFWEWSQQQDNERAKMRAEGTLN